MIRKYETAILFDTEVPEDARKEFLAKLTGIIGDYKGEVLKQDDWGTRRLAYPINKKVSAFYMFLYYTGDRGAVEEIERNIKIFDGVLRYMTTICTTEVKAKPVAAPIPEETALPEIPPDATPAPPAPVVE